MTREIAIVGGGIAGMVVAWELARAGFHPHLFESSPALGGCIARHTVAGLTLDAGAESFATATPAVAELIGDLGLESVMVTPNPVGAWVRHAGGSVPLPRAALLGIPSRPFAADVRKVLGPLGSLRAGLDLVMPAGFGAGRESLGALVTTRMGRTVVDRLVEPVAGGVYSTDPDELDVDAVAPRLRGAVKESGSLVRAVRRLRGGDRPGSAVGGLSGGMFSLVQRLEDELYSWGVPVSTGVPVGALRRVHLGWELRTPMGRRPASDVVLAVPGPAMAGLLTGVGIDTPELSTGTSDVLLVTLVVDHAGLDWFPRGTGVLVSAHASGVTAKALTHATAKWAWLAEVAGPGRHVLRLSYGRGDQALPNPEDLVDLALADAAVLTGVPLDSAVLIDSDIVRWTSALPRPQPGHRAAVDRLRGHLDGADGLMLTGSMVAGTGLASVVADARAVAAAVIARR